MRKTKILIALFSVALGITIMANGHRIICFMQNGHPMDWGVMAGKFCSSNLSDGGKDCVDNLDCKGECVAPKDSMVGSSEVGSCQFYIHDRWRDNNVIDETVVDGSCPTF